MRSRAIGAGHERKAAASGSSNEKAGQARLFSYTITWVITSARSLSLKGLVM
jgi:hypothetical protein